MENIYEKSSEYGGKIIKESKKGWLVEGWSRYQGNPTNYKFLIPFENCPIKKGENLHDIYIKKGENPENPYNEVSKGGYLMQNYWITMDNEFKVIKILNRGFLVQ